MFLLAPRPTAHRANFEQGQGDEVIVHLTNLAGSCKRVPDVLARIGGKEFALLLPETDLPQAQMAAERLRCDIDAHPLVLASQSIPATVSIGIAAISPEMSNISQLMSAADKALYEAKRAGRNRVMCSLPSGCFPGALTAGEEARATPSQEPALSPR